MRPAIEFAIRDLKLNSGHSIASFVTLFLLSLSGAISSLAFALKFTANFPYFVLGIIIASASAFASTHAYAALKTDLPVYLGIGATCSTLRNILLFETLLPILIGVIAGCLFGIISFDIGIAEIRAITGLQLVGLSSLASLIGVVIGTFTLTEMKLTGEKRS
jgi:hypothetical protein